MKTKSECIKKKKKLDKGIIIYKNTTALVQKNMMKQIIVREL